MENLQIAFPVNELAAVLVEKLIPIFRELQTLPAPPAERYLTRKETAALLNVSLPTLNEYTKTDKITASRFGVRVLYALSEIEQRLNAKKELCHA